MQKNLCPFRDMLVVNVDQIQGLDKQVVKLQLCLKDIREHKRRYQIYGVETEIPLTNTGTSTHFQSTSKFGKSVYLFRQSSSSWFRIAAHKFKMHDTRHIDVAVFYSSLVTYAQRKRKFPLRQHTLLIHSLILMYNTVQIVPNPSS